MFGERERLKYLIKISQEMMSAFKLEDILNRMAEYIVELVGAKRSLFLLFDPIEKRILGRYGYGYDDSHVHTMDFNQIDIGLSGHVSRIKKPYYSENAQVDVNNNGIAREKAKEFNTGPIFICPLFVDEQFIGTLTAMNLLGDHELSEDKKNVIEMLATQASLAIKKTTLLEQIGCARDLAKIISESTIIENLEKTLTVLTLELKKLLDCKTVSVSYIFRNEFDLLIDNDKVVTVSCNKNECVVHEQYVNSTFKNILSQNKPIVSTVFNFKECNKNNIGKFVAVRLKYRKQKLGILSIEYQTLHKLLPEELVNIQLFANQAAITIRNSQLFRKERRWKELSENQLKIGETLTKELDFENILKNIPKLIYKLLCEERKKNIFSTFYMVDQNDLIPKASYPNKQLKKIKSIPLNAKNHIIESYNKDVIICNNGFDKKPLLKQTMFNSLSSLALPIKFENQIIGVLNIESSIYHTFITQEITAIQTFSNQVTIALNNTYAYSQAKLLQEVSKATSAEKELIEILDIVITNAIKITNTEEGSILLFDKRLKLFIKAFAKTKSRSKIKPYMSFARASNGVARNIIYTNKRIVVSDSYQLDTINKVALKKKRLSFIGVPISINDNLSGVLFVSNSVKRNFTKSEIAYIESLINQTSFAIKRSIEYDKLKKAKGLVGAKDVLAWMAIVSATWKHEIGNLCDSIRNRIMAFRNDLKKEMDINYLNEISSERIDAIEEIALKIKKTPITAPLSKSEKRVEIYIKSFVTDLINLFQKDGIVSGINVKKSLSDIDDDDKILANMELVSYAFNMIFRNSVESMSLSRKKEITIKAIKVTREIEIEIIDTGKGIDGEILDKIFYVPTKKAEGGRGSGEGLLITQLIVERYGGNISIKETGPKGTKISLVFPLYF